MIGICGLLLGSCGKKENPGVEPPLPGPKPVSPELQRQAEKINAQMTTLRSLIGALARTELSSLREEESGTKLLFRDGTELTVVCSPSADGMPLIGVMPDGEAYYWTLAAGEKPQPLADEAGKRLPVSGDLPQLGVDGDGYWTLTAGERTPWRIVDAAGAPLRADEAVQTALFRSITEEAGRVEILLTDKTRLSTVRVTDLSAAGRANCYQVPAPGRYAFDATLRGNGVGDAATAWNIDKRTVTVGEAAAAPMTFFSAKVGATGAYDWLTQPVAGLWGAAKTLNDPCPPGYKVPEVTAWEGIATGNNYVEGVSAWDDPNFGITLTFDGRTGWYPAQGYRFHSYGSIAGLRASNGGSGYYWSSTPAGRNARYLFFRRPLSTSSGSINLSLDNVRSAGYTVRCCRE